jgi:hypothetical protein
VNQLLAPLLDHALKAVADRRGARRIRIESMTGADTEATVYAVLEYLRDNPSGACPELGNVIVCDELTAVLKDMDRRGFRFYWSRTRYPWAKIRRMGHVYRVIRGDKSTRSWSEVKKLREKIDSGQAAEDH